MWHTAICSSAIVDYKRKKNHKYFNYTTETILAVTLNYIITKNVVTVYLKR